MIKVIFIDETRKNYRVGCRQLGCTTWDDVDYLWAYGPIATIIGVDKSVIKDWNVL